MKYIRLFDSADKALGETKTPVVFYLKGAPKPMFASKEKWGDSCIIVVDDTEGSAGIKPKGFTIIFKDDEGNIINLTEYKSGETIVIPEAPVKSGLTFIGWGDVEIDKAVTNMTYFAQYEVTPKVTINMNDTYTDVSSIALNATKTETVTGNISFEISLSTDYYEITDNVMVFKKHYVGDMTVTASAKDKHDNTQSDSKVISISCAGADTVTYAISNVSSPTVSASATSATITYDCNVTTTTHAGVSNTVTTHNTKVVEFEANNTNNKITRSGSFECEHGETVNWTVVHNCPVPDGYVDLGLPSGTLWATTNIGADSPTSKGYYFQYGSTESVTSPSCATLPGNGGNSSYNQTSYEENRLSIVEPVGSYYMLRPECDCVYIATNGLAKIPTLAQWTELAQNCTMKFWYDNMKFTSKINGQELMFYMPSGYKLNNTITTHSYNEPISYYLVRDEVIDNRERYKVMYFALLAFEKKSSSGLYTIPSYSADISAMQPKAWAMQARGVIEQ